MSKALIVKLEAGIQSALVGLDQVMALVDGWKEHLDRLVRAGDLAETSRSTYIVGVEKFVEWCRCARCEAVGEETVLEWKAALLGSGRKPGAINTWLAGVRSLFGWAVRAGRLPADPTVNVRGERRKGTARRHKRDVLTDAEVRRVLALPDETPAGRRDLAMLALMAYTGARTVEIHRADMGDLRTESGRMVLGVRGKGRSEADDLIVIAHPDAQAALHDWLARRGTEPGPLFTSLSDRSKGGRLSLSAVRMIVKAYYRAAGVVGDGKTTHSLRHSALTSAVRHGAPVQKVQSMARHANVTTTMIYFHELDRVTNPAEEFVRYDQ